MPAIVLITGLLTNMLPHIDFFQRHKSILKMA